MALANSLTTMTAIPTEFFRVYTTLVKLGVCDVPVKMAKSFWSDSQLDHLIKVERLYEILGDALLGSFDSLGPVYGKAGQVFLSRLSDKGQNIADRLHLTRLYGDWPPLPFEEVERVLDREIPHWREELRVDPNPLGVASMAQVHRAETLDGKIWAIKMIKPQAKRRLKQTLAALDQGIALLDSLGLTSSGKRFIKELGELSSALKLETALDLEKDNIDRVRQMLVSKKNSLLRIPLTLEKFSNDNVLTIEFFQGTPLIDLVTGKAQVSEEVKKKLAKRMLNELLVQVFEIGIFHADPHAGNLILLDNGDVGLFDWGLTGELTESDRKHIAGILKALLLLDLDRLAETLLEMSEGSGQEVSLASIRTTLGKLANLIKKKKADGDPIPLHVVLEESLAAAEELSIVVPSGLLLMAKSLVTIEGLAKGIDPNVSLAKIASPVLFKAAKPGVKDMLTLSWKIPGLTKKFLFGRNPES